MECANCGKPLTPKQRSCCSRSCNAKHVSRSRDKKSWVANLVQSHKKSDYDRSRFMSDQWIKRKEDEDWYSRHRHRSSLNMRRTALKNVGNPRCWPKGQTYSGHYMKSSWEVRFAQMCDERGIKWQYEPEKFDLGHKTYLPDFYLPEYDHWIEVKPDYKMADALETNIRPLLRMNKFIHIVSKSHFKSFLDFVESFGRSSF